MRYLFAVLLLAVTACGDGSGPSDVIPAELVGTWLATPACLPACGFTFARVTDPTDTINVVSFVGLTMEISLRGSGQFRMEARPGSIPPLEGQAEVAGSMLIVRSGADRDTLDYTVTATRLTVTWRTPYDIYDFDGDAENDPAWVKGVFARQ